MVWLVFPFLTSIAVVLMILDDQKLSRTLAFTQVSLGGLFIVVSLIFIDIIVLDNYISKYITLNSWINVNETI
jgi:hypothetical protein